jgi:MFS family permease
MGIKPRPPLIGLIATKIHNYKKTMFFATTIALAALLCVLYMPALSLYSVRALLFVYGLCTSNMLLCFSLVSIEHSKEGQGHATAIGFTNMMIMAVGAAFQPVVGWLLDINKEILNSALPSLFEFRTALSVLPLCLVLALVLLSWIKTRSAKPSLQVVRPSS